MGFKIALNLYADRSAKDVTDAHLRFYEEFGAKSAEIFKDKYRESFGSIPHKLMIYSYPPHWVAVDIELRPEAWLRERQLYISRLLKCSGLFVFEYDGDYWGYELFEDGKVLDRFTTSDSHHIYFENFDCRGNFESLARCLSFLSDDSLRPYLVRLPDCDTMAFEQYDKIKEETNDYPRPGDEFKRWDECASVNFLRALGISVDIHWKGGDFYTCPVYAEIDLTT